MKKIFYFFIIFVFSTVSAQESHAVYDKLRHQLTTSPTEFFDNVEKAKFNAIYSNDNQLVVKLDYLKGFGYYMNNQADSAIYYANSSIKNADQINYTEGKVMGLRLLGTQYAKMGLLKEAEIALNDGLDLIKNYNSEEAYDLRGSLYASKLVLMDDTVNLEEKLNVAKASINAYEKLKSEKRKKEVLPLAYTNTSYMYTRLNQFDSAYTYSTKAIKMVDKKDKYMNASIYHDLGLLFLNQKKYEEAVKYLNIGLSYCDSNTFISKKQEILKRLIDAYTALGDYKKANVANTSYRELSQLIDKSSKSAVRSIVHDKNSKIDKLTRYEKLFYISLFLLIVMTSCLYVFYKKKLKSKNKTIKTIEVKDSFSINNETRNKILEELNKFESEEAYINQDVTLYYLSNKIGCNTKYLSKTIKEEFGKSFSNYINDLRIDYLLRKLESDNSLLNYKISHLAKMIGFSSAPTFIKAFQKRTTMNPSQYLKERNS